MKSIIFVAEILSTPSEPLIPESTEPETPLDPTKIDQTLITFESLKVSTVTVLKKVTIKITKTVTIVEGVVKTALELKGLDSMVQIKPNKKNTCIADLMKCIDTGFTISLKMKIIEVEKDSFIFSSGGEREDSYGLALKYVAELNVYKAIVTTTDKQWILKIEKDKIVTDKWITLDLSFRGDTGVALYVDSKLLAREIKYEKRAVTVEKSVVSSLFIGHSSTSTIVEVSATVQVEVVNFFSATRESLVRADAIADSKCVLTNS